MALANAIKGARHTAQRITWTDDDGTAVNLTGATLTGKIKHRGVTRAIDGSLALVTAASGIFDWTYGATDVGTVGAMKVQIIATYGDSSKDKTYISDWKVEDALD